MHALSYTSVALQSQSIGMFRNRSVVPEGLVVVEKALMNLNCT